MDEFTDSSKSFKNEAKSVENKDTALPASVNKFASL